MEAPTPIKLNEKEINEINFLKEDWCSKINNEEYIIKIGTLKEFLVIKVYNKNEMKNSFISYFNYEQLRNISKSMRYFDNINDIIKFLEEKGKKNEILLKKQNDNIYLEFKIISPNGNQDNVSLEIKPEKISDKEMISILVKKNEYLEKEVELLKEKVNKSDNIISKNKSDILSLFEEIRF